MSVEYVSKSIKGRIKFTHFHLASIYFYIHIFSNLIFLLKIFFSLPPLQMRSFLFCLFLSFYVAGFSQKRQGKQRNRHNLTSYAMKTQNLPALPPQLNHTLDIALYVYSAFKIADKCGYISM